MAKKEKKEVKEEPLEKKLWEAADNNQDQIRTLTKLRDTLLAKLISGEVGVEV